MKKHLAMAAMAMAVLWGGVAGAASSEGSAIAVLDRPDQPVEIIAGDARVMASYAAHGGGFTLYMRLTAEALGDAELRTKAQLADGQTHKIVLGPEGGDSFTFTRRGNRIDVVAFDAVSLDELAQADVD